MKFRDSWYLKRRSLIGATALLAASAVQAADPGRLTLSAYSDGVAGDAVMAGHYAAAIGQLAPHGVYFTRDAVSASTNLCVAYIATGQFEPAKAACDEAVDLARLDGVGRGPLDRANSREAQALAESNREVLAKLHTQVLARLETR